MSPDELLKMLPPSPGFKVLKVDLGADHLETDILVESKVKVLVEANSQGWIARQSGVLILPGTDDTSLGAVLEAELSNGMTTIQIRKLSAGWGVTRIVEGTGQPALASDVILVATNGKSARYRQYWSTPDCGAAEIKACRFIGFETFEEARQ